MYLYCDKCVIIVYFFCAGLLLHIYIIRQYAALHFILLFHLSPPCNGTVPPHKGHAPYFENLSSNQMYS